MKRIYIVTGANGFLGNNIVRNLPVKENDEIRALVLPNDKIHSLDGVNCKIYKGDVTNKESLKDIFDVNDDSEVVVIHCAAVVYIKEKYDENVFYVNVHGTENMADKCIETSSRMVYVSSVHAIEEPEDNRKIVETKEFDPDRVQGIYAKSKAQAARLIMNKIQNENLNVCIVHPSGIIGLNDFGNTHMTNLIVKIANGNLPAILKGGYDFVDVRDVVTGVISAIDKGKKGETYILSNRYITIQEIADLTSKYSGSKKVNIVLPMWIAKLGAPFCEIYYNFKKQVPLYTRYSLYTLHAKSNFSNTKAREELGYKNRSLEETIRDMVAWLKEQGRIKNINRELCNRR